MTRDADYAVRVALDLAAHAPGALVRRAGIARRQGVPGAYLAKIVQRMARGGLVTTRRGVAGGVALARDPTTLTLGEVITALDGLLCLNRCVERPGACPRDRFCPVHPVWLRVQRLVEHELAAVTIADLVRSHGTRGNGA